MENYVSYNIQFFLFELKLNWYNRYIRPVVDHHQVVLNTQTQRRALSSQSTEKKKKNTIPNTLFHCVTIASINLITCTKIIYVRNSHRNHNISLSMPNTVIVYRALNQKRISYHRPSLSHFFMLLLLGKLNWMENVVVMANIL